MFGGKKAQILVEKEVKITAIDGAKLSFLMPTGQRVFLSAGGDLKSELGKVENERERSADERIETEDENIAFDRTEDSIGGGKTENAEAKHEVKDNTQMDIDPHPASQTGEDPPSQTLDEPTQEDASTQYNLKGIFDYAQPLIEAKVDGEKHEIESKEATPTAHQPEAPGSPVAKVGTGRKRGRPAKRKSPIDEVQDTLIEVNGAIEIETAEISKEDTKAANNTENGVNADPVLESALEQGHKNAESSQQSALLMETSLPETTLSSKSEESESAQCSATTTPLEVEIHNIAGPNALMKKILETDGRVKNPPNGNAWKEIRCYRNNQDMGSLWEVRQAWYVKYQQD